MRTPFLAALFTACLLHLGGLAVAAFFWRALGVAPLHFPPLVARVVPVEPPPEPVLPLAPEPPVPEPVTPPKLVEQVDLQPAEPHRKPLPPAKPVRLKKPAPAQAPQLAPALPQPEATAGNVLGPSPLVRSQETPLTPVEGGEAGAGRLFDQGNVAVVPGPGVGGGSGGPGNTGLGLGAAGSGAKEGGARPGGGSRGGGSGGGAVRPLGGYQVKPRYPELARRQGIAGTVLLKVRVTEQGRVETVQVERSAGHPALDQSAADAVQRWRFEPARQGGTPVAVWVQIPVEFKLEY